MGTGMRYLLLILALVFSPAVLSLKLTGSPTPTLLLSRRSLLLTTGLSLLSVAPVEAATEEDDELTFGTRLRMGITNRAPPVTDPRRDPSTSANFPPPPALLLPITKVLVQAKRAKKLTMEGSFEAALLAIRQPALKKTAVRSSFNAYTDYNWGAHLVLDLYRNQALQGLRDADELLSYILSDDGAKEDKDSIEDVVKALDELIAAVTGFLSFANAADVAAATAAAEKVALQ